MTNTELKELNVENKLTLGRLIAKYRKQAKLTQQELADKIGVNKASIYQYEKDKLMPRYNRLQEIVTLLNVPEQELYGVLLPQAEYTDEDAQEIQKLHDADISLYSFLWHMGVDVRSYFFTNKQWKDMFVEYNNIMYKVSEEKRERFYAEVKDFTVYQLEKMLRGCETRDALYEGTATPDDPNAQAVFELKHVGQMVNKIFDSNDETE